MGDSTLATFRIEQSLWDEFKTHCSQNGDSASGRLLKLILADMGKSEDLTLLNDDIDKRIESYLESHLDKFIDKASRTDLDDSSIQRLDSRIDSLRDNIEKALATSLTQLSPVPETKELDYEEGIRLKIFVRDYLGITDYESVSEAVSLLYRWGQTTYPNDPYKWGILEPYRQLLLDNWKVKHPKADYSHFRMFPQDIESAKQWRKERFSHFLSYGEGEGIAASKADRLRETLIKITSDLEKRVKTNEEKPIYGKPTPKESPIEEAIEAISESEEVEGITDGTLPLTFDEPKTTQDEDSHNVPSTGQSDTLIPSLQATTPTPPETPSENDPLNDTTPSDDDLPIVEDSEGDKGEIEGQSEKVTETGLTNQQLSDLLKVPKSTVEKWKTSLKKGEAIKPRKYPNFMSEWKLGDDSLWYSIN